MENLEQAPTDLSPAEETAIAPDAPESIPDAPPALEPPAEASKLTPHPRTMDEIRKHFGELVGRAGHKAYELACIESELKGTPLSGLFGEMASVNQEAAERNELDQKLSADKLAKAKAKRERKAEQAGLVDSAAPEANAEPPESAPAI